MLFSDSSQIDAGTVITCKVQTLVQRGGSSNHCSTVLATFNGHRRPTIPTCPVKKINEKYMICIFSCSVFEALSQSVRKWFRSNLIQGQLPMNLFADCCASATYVHLTLLPWNPFSVQRASSSFCVKPSSYIKDHYKDERWISVYNLEKSVSFQCRSVVSSQYSSPKKVH